MKKLLVLLFSFLFLVSPYISANEQLIGSWENDKGLRMDILAGFKANVGPVIYWENEEASKVFKWQVNPNNNDLKISYSTRGYSLLENGNLRWGNDIFQKLNNIERKNVIDLKSQNTNITFHYFNTTPIEGLPFMSNFIFKNRLGMPRPHNVLIPSLMIGITEGYEKISVLGADHSWLAEISVNEKNEALVNQKHFYDDIRI